MKAKIRLFGGRGGFSLVEAVIGSFLLAVIVAGVYSAGSTMLRQVRRVNNARAAITLMQQQIETMRGLDFSRLGIQASSGIVFYRHTPYTNKAYNAQYDRLLTRTNQLSENVMATLTAFGTAYDDPNDGVGNNDADGETQDALRIRSQITWISFGRAQTRSLEALVCGVDSEIGEYDPIGTTPDEDPSTGDGDPGQIDILLATFKDKDNELKVSATDDSKGTNTLTLVGYGVMSYDKKKDLHSYSKKNVANPGASVTVTSSNGRSESLPVTPK